MEQKLQILFRSRGYFTAHQVVISHFAVNSSETKTEVITYEYSHAKQVQNQDLKDIKAFKKSVQTNRPTSINEHTLCVEQNVLNILSRSIVELTGN